MLPHCRRYFTDGGEDEAVDGDAPDDDDDDDGASTTAGSDDGGGEKNYGMLGDSTRTVGGHKVSPDHSVPWDLYACRVCGHRATGDEWFERVPCSHHGHGGDHVRH